MRWKYIPNGKGHIGPQISAKPRGKGPCRGSKCGFMYLTLYIAEITCTQINHVNRKGVFVSSVDKIDNKCCDSNHVPKVPDLNKVTPNWLAYTSDYGKA